jgi:hypothetical protein
MVRKLVCISEKVESMSLHSVSFRALAVAAVALSGTFGIMAAAAPAGASSSAGSIKLSVGPASTAALPNTNIVGTKPKYGFHPDALSVTWSAPPPATSCTVALEKMTVTNKTSVTQTLTYSGKTFGTLKKGQAAGICFWGTGSHVFKFFIKGQKTHVSVTVT